MANIIGTNQDDNLVGTNENDIITPKLGNDFVDGGAGIDTLVLDFSSLDSVSGNFDAAASGSGSYNGSGSGGKFSNISFTSIERLNITGSKGNDFFRGGAFNDVLRGGAGNDTLYGEAGNDIIEGGIGNDFLDGGAGNDLILGGSGNDFITSGGGADIINGGDGKDALLDADFSNSTQNLVFRDSGKTYGRLSLANGTIATNIEFLDGITTGSGNDRILYSLNRNNFINTGDGNDTINAGLGRDVVDGGAGDDLLIIDYSSTSVVTSSIFGNSGFYAGFEANSPFGLGNLSFTNIERLDVTGSSGNDSINGLSGNDILRGGAGNDRIFGNGGADFIYGGTGDDQIFSNGGTAFIDGGAGIDGIDGDFSSATTDLVFTDATFLSGRITLPNGTVVINVELFDNLITGSGNDQISFSRRRDNIINTGDGNDTIYSGLGQDTIDGGAGDDLLIIDYSSTDGVNSILGDDRVIYVGFKENSLFLENISFTNIERLDVIGSSGNDLMNGLSGNDILRGGAGNDRILGNGGADFLYGGIGDDQLFNNGGAAFIDGGAGIDGIEGDFSSATTDLVFTDATFLSGTITLSNGAVAVNVELFDNLTTGSGNDQISFSRDRDNTINTGAGNDIINVGSGSDFIDGGTGDDLLIVDYSSASASLTFFVTDQTIRFSNTFVKNIERLDVTGSAGNDILYGLSGNDILRGGDGDDRIFGNGGIDFIDGGAGIDNIDGDFSTTTTDLVFTDATFLSGTITLPNGTVAVNVELFDNLTTGSGNDQISFSRNRNNLINTGDGNDTINTGLGYDFVDGGAGDDLLIIDYSMAGLVYSSVSGDSGFYSSFDLMGPGGPGTINFSGIERLDVTGSVGNDRLYGTFGNDVFKAGLGSDYISAASGDDFIQLGNDGFSDTIVYNDGDGADTIVGFEQGSTGDELFIDNIAAVDVVTTYNSSGWKTQVYLGDGISGNAGFGSGSLIATLTNTQLTTADVGINLRSNSGAQFLFA